MRTASINWQEVRDRLEASENALQRALSENPERVRAAYRQRAIQLAKSPTQARFAPSGVPGLIFRLAAEKYAIRLADLAEVLPFNGCTPVPGGSPKFLGVLSLRGELRPIVDLGLLLSEKPSGDAGFILILHRQIGLKVDHIEDLREIRPEEFDASGHERYTRGLASGSVMLLDVEAVLSAVFSAKES
jgi:purine-binding chemotaxis protein CheW